MATIPKLKFPNLNKVVSALTKAAKKAKQMDQGSVIVGYTANYAVYVHESIEMKLKGKPRPNKKGKFWDPQNRAQAKFLEQPARDRLPELNRVITGTVKKTGDVNKGLLVGGLRLQRESQRLVPVNTGNLKNSAFTRVER